MKFCLTPTQQLTLLPLPYIQLSFPHTECQVFCYFSFTPTSREGEGIFNHPASGSSGFFLSPVLSWDSCNLLWACLNFIGHSRTLRSSFQPFLIWEYLLVIPICLHLSYYYLWYWLRKKYSGSLAPGSKVLVKVMAFGSSFTLHQEHRNGTVKQSCMVSGTSNISMTLS